MTKKAFSDPAEAAACLAEQLTVIGMSLCSNPEVVCLALHGAARAATRAVLDEASSEQLARFRELLTRIDSAVDEAHEAENQRERAERN